MTKSVSADDGINFDDPSDDDIDAILAGIENGDFEDVPVVVGEDLSTIDSDHETDKNLLDEPSAELEDDQNVIDQEETKSLEVAESTDDLPAGEQDNTDNYEDTKGEPDAETTEETKDKIDGDGSETSEISTDADPDNSLVKKDIDGKDKDTASETKDNPDGDDKDTVKLDQVEFDKYKKFYDQVVNAEFTANGKTVKGFSDPAKIIQSQQMSYGFSDKMAGFKQYRPYMAPLKKLGMIDDPEKFNKMIDLFTGDKEALKLHIKSLDIDPVLDLDTDITNYVGKNHLASNEIIALEDSMEVARSLGVEDRVKEIVGKSWDEESWNDFKKDSNFRASVIDDLSTGVFDEVQERISEIKRTDINGSFTGMRDSEQYNFAINQLSKEFEEKALESEKIALENKAKSELDSAQAKLKLEKDKIQKAKEEEEYRLLVEANNEKAAAKRKQASSLSQKKPKAKVVKKFDPMDLEGDDLDAFVNQLIGV